MSHAGRRSWRATGPVVAIAICFAVTAPVAAAGHPTGSGATLSAALVERMAVTGAPIDVIVVLRDRADIVTPARGTRAERQREVARALRGTADRAQGPLRTRLAQLLGGGRITRVQPLWIVDAVALSAPPDVIAELASRPEVASIDVDRTIAAPSLEAAASSTPIEPNISLIGAPTVWTAGDTGAGVVVATVDTGVDLAASDLAAHWRGGTNSWFDPYGRHPASPVDLSGHGTATMGVILGGSATGTQLGVAPGASWIAAKGFDDSGLATTSALHRAYQWILDPDGNPATPDAPDVVNSSWTMNAPGCSLEFAADIAALRAAGILPVFAAGNSGPGSSTDVSPANNPGALAVGATDNADGIAVFSSRGPTTCSRSTATAWPDLTAPGVAITSTDRFGLTSTSSGTSIAAPHVAGTLALLLARQPSLSVDQQQAALVTGLHDLGSPGPDSTYGSGRLDAAASWSSLGGGGGGGSDVSGPTTMAVAASPALTTGLSTVTISATVDDTATGGSPVVGAELFVDATVVDGTGQLLAGTYGPGPIVVSGTLEPAVLATLADGNHIVRVHGRDGAGNWGPAATAVLTVDRRGPGVTGTSTNPPISRGAASVTVAAVADDSSGVRAAEWFLDVDAGPGLGTAMTAADGAFDGSHESLRGAIGTAGIANGEHIVGIRARDALGTWGAPAVTTAIIGPADTIFADGFETGSLSSWSSTSGSSGLAVRPDAAAAGRYGLQVQLSRSASYVVDTTPVAEPAFRARFTLDASAASTNGQPVTVLAALNAKGASAVSVEVRRSSGAAELRAIATRQGGTATTPWITLGPGARTIEVGWVGAKAGSLELRVDGSATTIAGIDTGASRVDTVRLGAVSGLGRSTSGPLRIDRYVSTRTTLIGA